MFDTVLCGNIQSFFIEKDMVTFVAKGDVYW
jgi:hypothetical protein